MRFLRTIMNRKGKPIDVAKLKVDCSRFLADKGVVVCYLFGSYASTAPSDLSDVDIAVLFDEDVPREEYFNRELELIGIFQRLVDDEAVDLGRLNGASVDFAYEVIKGGKVIYEESPEVRIDFETRTTAKYLDMAPIREEYFSALRRRAKEGKLGTKPA